MKEKLIRPVYIFVVFALLLAGCDGLERKRVYFKESSFLVEVARTRQEQIKGLMFRKYLPANAGMLFIFKEHARHAFHMKNMYIPLDIIWMDKNKLVVFIKKNARPADGDCYEIIRPDREAKYVLELNAGVADKIGLKTGDILKFF